jgi:hypothetical protein
MPNPFGPPGCPYDPGAEPPDDRIDVRTVSLHRTIGLWNGDYSVGKNRTHAQGTFQFLIGQQPGQWVQFYAVNNFCSHGYGANRAGPGIELSGQNGEALTDWQIDALGQILRWLRDEWGIAPTFTDGDPRVQYDTVGPSGFVTHRNIYSDIPKYTHYDYITEAEFVAALGATPGPPGPGSFSQEEPVLILRNSDVPAGPNSDHLVRVGVSGYPLSIPTSDDLHAQGVPRIPLPGLVILQWAATVPIPISV